MDVSKPLAAISPGVDADVLAVLASSTHPRSGREVARYAKRSNTGVQHVLDRLVEHGLVDRQEAGRTFLYTLNHDHLLAPVVQQMSGIRLELVERLRRAIEGWGVAPTHASLFGSAARGDGGPDSDIDVLLIRPKGLSPDSENWREQVDGLADSIRRWTGNPAGIVEISEQELPRLRKDRPPVVDEIQKDAVDLAGMPTRKLLAHL
jgi:predicted transcriptional regulator